MKNITFAILFGNRGFFPGSVIAAAREEMCEAVARAGAEGYEMTVGEDFTIPAECERAEVKIEYNSEGGRIGILRQGGGNTVNPVSIGGVKGTLALEMSADAPEGAWIATVDEKFLHFYFVREAAGEPVAVRKGERLYNYGIEAHKGQWLVIYIGCNGGWQNDIDYLIRQQEKLIAAQGGTEKLVIVGNHFGTPEKFAEMDRRMAERWGEKYLPLRRYFASEEAYRDAGADDATVEEYRDKIAEGITSSYFLRDSVHFNPVGNRLFARQVLLRMEKLGYFDD